MQKHYQVLKKDFCAPSVYHIKDQKIYLTTIDGEEIAEINKILAIYFPSVLFSLITNYFDGFIYELLREEKDRNPEDIFGFPLYVSPNNRYAYIGNCFGYYEEVIDLFERKTIATIRKTTRSHYNRVSFIEIMGSTKLIYFPQDDSLELWDVATWKKERELNITGVSIITVSPDSRWLIMSGYFESGTDEPGVITKLLSVEKWPATTNLEVYNSDDIGFFTCWMSNDCYAILYGNERRDTFRIDCYQQEKKYASIPLEKYHNSTALLLWDEKLQLLFLINRRERTLTALDVKAGANGKFGRTFKNTIVVGTHPTKGIVIFNNGKFQTLNLSREELFT